MTITYQGKLYPTIKALAEAYTVDYGHLRKMIRKGWTVEDAMKVCKNQTQGKGKLYEFEGRGYRSSKRMKEDLGVPWKSLSHFLIRCDSVEEVVKRCRNQNCIMEEGIPEQEGSRRNVRLKECSYCLCYNYQGKHQIHGTKKAGKTCFEFDDFQLYQIAEIFSDNSLCNCNVSRNNFLN